MTRRACVAVAWLLLSGLSSAAPQAPTHRKSADTASQTTETHRDGTLAADLDRLFDDPLLASGIVGARVTSLADGRLLYGRHADTLVIPASNMKLITIAVAAATLGWQYRYETTLEATGDLTDGTLRGDLIVTGTGDPSIGSPDDGHAPLFLEWAHALQRAGIRRVDGRIVGDDDAFEDQALGEGWSWDDLAYGYAAPVGALNYNENAATLRLKAGPADGSAATVQIGPPGHGLEMRDAVSTGTPGSLPDIELERFPGRRTLVVRGRVPRSDTVLARTAAVDNPTRFFVDALRLALESRGIQVTQGAWDVDDLALRPASTRRLIATHRSLPLSTLAAYALDVSQNQYTEVFLKTLGRTAGTPGSTTAGKRVVLDTLATWGVPSGSVVMHDGSGLSRYNYVTASTLVAVLTHVWNDDQLRGPFIAGLPIAGAQGGTLALRMREKPLAGNVQAKTGTLSNVRALSGILRTPSGELLVFSIVANHYTAPTRDVDAVVERALTRLATTTARDP